MLGAPEGVGIVRDQSFELTWTDADRRFETSTVTFDFLYTRTPPPPAPPGVLPFAIEGRLIAVGIDEVDLVNRLTWNTAQVPAGSYVLWSIAYEEPPDLPVTMVSLSRGVVTIAHPGDPVYPAVLVGLEAELSSSDGFGIPYEAFDPVGTASVTFSVSRNFDGSGAVVVGRGLPASPRGTFYWSAEGFAPGRYSVRARISDARGLAFANYGRFYLRVDPSAPPTPDAGPRDAGDPDAADVALADADGADAELGPPDATPATGPDAGAASPPDAGPPAEETSGCRCQREPSPGPRVWLLLAVVWAVSRRSRRQIDLPQA